jgi:hypothetical protein
MKKEYFKTKRPKTGRKFVLKEKKIDMFSTLRTRVLLTECVCDQCGFDLCEKNGLGEYADLATDEQTRVKQALKKHKELHIASEDRVVAEEDLPTMHLRSPRLVG